MMAKNLFQQEFRTPSVRELFGEHMDDLGLPLGPPPICFSVQKAALEFF
jgi:hypothetical protein